MKDEVKEYYNVQKYYKGGEFWYNYEVRFNLQDAEKYYNMMKRIDPESDYKIVKVTETKHYEEVE